MINTNSREFKDLYEKWKIHCRHIQEMTGFVLVESEDEKQRRISRAKNDYQYFVQTYFPHYVYDAIIKKNIECADFQIEWANAVRENKNFAGFAEWPREHAKSTHNTIFIPMWEMINGCLNGLVLGGKSEEDAARLLGDIQAELQFNKLFISDYGEQHNSGNWQEGDFITKDGIFFVALGRGQSPRGLRKGAKRPNMGVIDDIDDDEIVNNQDRVQRVIEWILGGFIGALDIRQSKFIMCGNRFHPKSILAHMVGDVEESDPKREGYYHSKIFATVNSELDGKPTWHQKYTTTDLQRRFQRVGLIVALKEYFHKYVIKGKRFKAEWWHWGKVPTLSEFDALVCYFDPSYKGKSNNDYKAIRFWGKLNTTYYLIDCFVKQTSITQAVKWLYDLYESLPENIIVDFFMEDVFLQDQFYEDFEIEANERGYYLPIRGDKRSKPEKFARIEAITPIYERGRVIWNEEKKKSPDMQTGYLQYMGFEKGSPIHDDAPDADEGAIFLLNRKNKVVKGNWKLGYGRNNNIW